MSNTLSNSPAHVILVHGLAGSPMAMWPLAWQLRKSGYSSSTFGYPSWFWSIEHHATRFRHRLDKLQNDESISEFNIVAHSMGTIVTRQAILEQHLRYTKLRRIVMLASPNQGSPVARVLGNVLPFCKTLRQLSTHPESFVRQLPEPQRQDIGIVAAKYDRVVPVSHSRLAAASGHTVLFSGHNGLLVRPAAARLVIEFLNHGSFSAVESSSSSSV